MRKTITLIDARGAERAITVLPDQTLAQALFLDPGVEPRALCSGLARCGRCKVRFVSQAPAPGRAEREMLSRDELDAGLRLACRHPATPGIRVALVDTEKHVDKAEISGLDAAKGRDLAQGLALAVDLGTTSLNWAALAPETGDDFLAQGRELNPQMGAGAEIMSRLAYAANPAQAGQLRDAVLYRLQGLVKGLEADCGARVREIVLAGNPAMVCLALGKPLHGLDHAPYSLPWPGGQVVRLDRSTGYSGLPPVYVPPLLGPFVGADLSAGLAAIVLGQNPPPFPFVLADMGTNGEFILALEPDTYLAASVALGPALEGVGPACGGLAGDGAITGFSLGLRGLKPKVLGKGPQALGPNQPDRISGTGYLSLLAALLRAGVLLEDGRFTPDQELSSPLARTLAGHIKDAGPGQRFTLPGGLYVSAADIEELLKVKAAFNLAFTVLLGEAGLKPADVKALCLAGALGEHVSPADLETLGFIPPGSRDRVRAVGNASLAGAVSMAIDPATRGWAARLPDQTRVLDLASDQDFSARFLARMVFTHVF